MNNIQIQTILSFPLMEFYNYCSSIYGLGSPLYSSTFPKIKKYCFNPYLSTECDVQMKLGGLIDFHIRKQNLPYSVNAEMKIYDALTGKNQMADLTIHKVPDDKLYRTIDAHKASLVAAIEIKYANAVFPDDEMNKGIVEADIKKLASLDATIFKLLVVIDEANQISQQWCNRIRESCNQHGVQLFSNNSNLAKWQPLIY